MRRYARFQLPRGAERSRLPGSQTGFQHMFVDDKIILLEFHLADNHERRLGRVVRAAHCSRLSASTSPARSLARTHSQTSDHPPSIIIYHPLAGVSIIASEVNASAVASSGTMDISAAIQWQNEMMQSRRALSCAVSSCAIVERCSFLLMMHTG